MYHQSSCDFSMNGKIPLMQGDDGSSSGSGHPIFENRSSFTVGEQHPITENRRSFTVVERPVVRECSDSFAIALRSELQRTFSEKEICRKTSVETIKFRLLDRIVRLLGVSYDDLREYLQPDKVFVHPQVAMRLDSIFSRQKCLMRNDFTGRVLDRVLVSDYNSLKDVQLLISQLETLVERCVDCKIVAELRTVLAPDGLGDCSQHLRYPLTTKTTMRARPIGSDYDAGRVHVMAVRKMYESNLTTNKKDVGKAINAFYRRTGGKSDGEEQLEELQSKLVRIYGESVGSFADQVWSQVVEPKVREQQPKFDEWKDLKQQKPNTA